MPRHLRLLATLALIVSLSPVPTPAQGPRPAPWPTAGWAVATPEAVGLDPAPWAALDSAIRAGRHGLVDHLVVVRHGYKVVDHHYPRDYVAINRGRRSVIGCGPEACDGWDGAPEFNYYDPARHPYRGSTRLHNLQSTSKSVLAMVVGAARHRGAIASLDVPVLGLLGPWRDVPTDPRAAGITLRHVLTMQSGIEWHEGDRPLDLTNTTVQLERSDDWVRFTLSQPMDAEPGAKWTYNSGGSHLLSAVVAEATGEPADAYARRHLFGPLGITRSAWKPGGGGLPDGESGVYLEAADLAKLGLLMLRDGVWDGQRLLPAGWALEATRRHAEAGGGRGYGYQWWRLDRGGREVWATMGFGGQFMLVVPSLDLVVVALGWNVYQERVEPILGALLGTIAAMDG